MAKQKLAPRPELTSSNQATASVAAKNDRKPRLGILPGVVISLIALFIILSASSISCASDTKPAASQQLTVTITFSSQSPKRLIWSSDLTLLSAIAAIGGYAWHEPRDLTIIRGSKKIVVHPASIRKGVERDPKLKPGDILEVGQLQ